MWFSMFLVLDSVSVLFHLLCVMMKCIRFKKLSGHLLGKSCSFDHMFSLLCLFVVFVVSYFGFEGRTLVLMASVPKLLLTFYFLLFFILIENVVIRHLVSIFKSSILCR